MTYYQKIGLYCGLITLGFFILFFPYIKNSKQEIYDPQQITILTYPSFMEKWGPGPDLAQLFLKKTGIPIQWISAGNAGLILERLRFRGSDGVPDVVLGMDQFALHEARQQMGWQELGDIYSEVKESTLPDGAQVHDFFAFDWGIMAFVYREGELDPPTSLDSLLDPKYSSHLIIQDPRMSSPGLQFFHWVLGIYGEEEGIQYLRKLKNSIRVVAPSWSSSYSLFQVTQGSVVFSYFTSPFYHSLIEKKDNYRSAKFNHPHPVQVEYLGIPDKCKNCSQAREFAKFMASPEAQTIVMNKNFMFPVNGSAIGDSPFQIPDDIEYLPAMKTWKIFRKKKELVEKWKKVFY